MTVRELAEEMQRLVNRSFGNCEVMFAKDEDTYPVDYVNTDTGGPLVLLVRD